MSIQSLTEAAKAAGFAMATSDELLTPTRQRDKVQHVPATAPHFANTVTNAAPPLGMAQRIRGFFVTYSRRAPA